jgi:uncharacterized protein YukE
MNINEDAVEFARRSAEISATIQTLKSQAMNIKKQSSDLGKEIKEWAVRVAQEHPEKAKQIMPLIENLTEALSNIATAINFDTVH